MKTKLIQTNPNMIYENIKNFDIQIKDIENSGLEIYFERGGNRMLFGVGQDGMLHMTKSPKIINDGLVYVRSDIKKGELNDFYYYIKEVGLLRRLFRRFQYWLDKKLSRTESNYVSVFHYGK